MKLEAVVGYGLWAENCTGGQGDNRIKEILAQVARCVPGQVCTPPVQPMSLGFSGQEHQSGLPCPPPGDLPDSGIEPGSPSMAPFQTTQGNRLSCRDQEGRRGSEEAVPGPSVSRGEAMDSDILLRRDRYLLEPTEWPPGSQASCGVGAAARENPRDASVIAR